jgi:hypothetical protein
MLIGLGKHSEVRAALEDLVFLLRLLGSRPTHIRELVPDMPHYVGYHDAAAEGAGGGLVFINQRYASGGMEGGISE